MGGIAVVRDVSRSITRCELTHRQREPIDYERAARQHEAYADALVAAGFQVHRLPADEACPDGCFVEDTAVVLDEIAILAMPGASSRRGELPAVEAALRVYRPIQPIRLPATLDGGDVLTIGKRLFVGLSSRTNAEGAGALRRAVAPYGYQVEAVPFAGCLHLKSAVSRLDDETVLVNPRIASGGPWRDYRVIEVDPAEPDAANVLAIGGEVWAHPGFPRTLERLASGGFRVVSMDISEFLKAEAGLTCKSLLFQEIPVRPLRLLA